MSRRAWVQLLAATLAVTAAAFALVVGLALVDGPHPWVGAVVLLFVFPLSIAAIAELRDRLLR